MLTVLDLPPLKLLYIRELASAPLPPPPVEAPYIDDSGLNLPPIGVPRDSNIPHIANVVNPGTSDPRAQNMERRLSVDQTMSVSGGTGPLVNSDGQMQIVDRGGAGQRGVTVTTGYAPLQNSDGNVQLPNITPQDHTTSSEQRPGGLPMEAKPDSQNATKMTRVWADPLPVATTVSAGNSRPGKLPTTHLIK